MPTVLVANPSADLYGADLQLLESVKALTGANVRVVVVAPVVGPLHDRLREAGAETRVLDFPVLRRADATPAGVARLGSAALRNMPAMRRTIREVGADVVYVNTLTLPWWVAAGRTMRRRVLCHAHEAEPRVAPVVQKAMALPLLMSDVVVANSRVTMSTLCQSLPRLADRTVLLYNGVEGPPRPPDPPRIGCPVRVVVVGRLSRRKAPHDALEAVSLLRASGVDATVALCGTPVPGFEDYEAQLRRRAAREDLAGAVSFEGYTSPIWPALARADVFLATSTAEPLGNAVVEAQLACRPVVATAVEGHLETVLPEKTGLLVPVGDTAAMAGAIGRLATDPELVRRVTVQARDRAEELFSSRQYGAAIVDLVRRLVPPAH